MCGTITRRCDPEYFQKQHLDDAMRVRDKADEFQTLRDLQIGVGASAFYPSIQGFYDSGELPFYRVGDVDGMVEVKRATKIPAKLCDEFPTLKRVRRGDILFTKGGAIDRVGYVIEEGAVSRDLIFLKTSCLPEPRRLWLFTYFRTAFFSRMLLRSSSQTAQPHLTLPLVRELPIFLASERLSDAVASAVVNAYHHADQADNLLQRAEDTLLEALGLADWTPPEPLSYTARASDALSAGRIDAQYFMPAKEQVRRSLAAMSGDSLGERMDSIRDMFVPDRAPATMKLRNYDVTDALVSLLDAEKEPSFAAEIGSNKKTFKDGDVAISRLRAYLREIAVVRTGDDIPSVGSSEFIVLRPKKGQCDISPETLMVFLRSVPVQTILKWCQDGSQHPRFSEGDLLSVPVPTVVSGVSGQITTIVKESFTTRHQARQLLEATKRAVEIAIEDGEADAMTFLDQADL